MKKRKIKYIPTPLEILITKEFEREELRNFKPIR